MQYPNNRKVHKGFTLLELLLVIFIISLVYFLGFSGAEKYTPKPLVLTPLTLKANIINSSIFQGKGTLICINNCRQCYLRADISSPFEEYKGKIKLDQLEVYFVDRNGALQKKEFGRYHDEKICLQINFYQNGSSSQLILKDSKGIYFLPAFFGKAQKVNSLSDAKALWLQYIDKISSEGNFY